jgi:tetratricopeptide (TPR) repeat protein
MGQVDWDMPRTEEGLQEALRQLETCRAAGDDIEVGKGLLALSYLVKWVRSDTLESPFVRSHELAIEALEAFRRADNVAGQVRALIAATAMTDPQTRESLLAEAEELARRTGDDNDPARVLAARARSLALTDRKRAAEMHRQTLEIFRRTGNERGQAQALFSLAIGEGTSEEKRDFALEASRLHREQGNPEEAARCAMIAFMNAEEIQPLCDLEALARQGLNDAQSAGDRGQEGHFYSKLALIAADQGRYEEAEKHRRWASELQEADGLTPLERWENEVGMTKTLIAMAKEQGNPSAIAMFKEELKRLKAEKPR